MKFLRRFIRSLPTLLTALVFAVAAWVYAVNQADPTETRTYPRSLELEVIGLAPDLTIVNDITNQVAVTLRAPASVLNQLENNASLLAATLDLSGLESGVHTLEPQVSVGLSPSEVVALSPASIFIKLDSIISQTFPIQVRTLGNPAIGFEAGNPELTTETVLISGPQSQVDSVQRVEAEISIVDASEDIERTVSLDALDAEGSQVSGVTLSPSTVDIAIPVTQRGGYRTVVVKIATSGQIAAGYRLTNIFAQPPTVTIYSSDPTLVEGVPGFVETTPINLNNAADTIEVRVALNLPEGINVVGSQSVTVQVGIEPVESSISFTNLEVQTEGLVEGLTAIIAPESVDVFLSGPLNVLESLDPAALQVVINLADRGPGSYQLAPEVLLENGDVTVDAILPNTLEVTITEEP